MPNESQQIKELINDVMNGWGLTWKEAAAEVHTSFVMQKDDDMDAVRADVERRLTDAD